MGASAWKRESGASKRAQTNRLSMPPPRRARPARNRKQLFKASAHSTATNGTPRASCKWRALRERLLTVGPSPWPCDAARAPPSPAGGTAPAPPRRAASQAAKSRAPKHMYRSPSWKSTRKRSLMSPTMLRMAAMLASHSAELVRDQSVFTLSP